MLNQVAGRPDVRHLTGRAASAVWIVAVVDVLGAGALVALPDFPLLLLPIVLAVAGAFAVVGALMVTRLPGNAVGWMLLTVATTIGIAFAGTAYSGLSVAAHGGTFPLTIPVAVVSQMTLIPMVGIVAVFLPLLFPDGHLPSPAWRGVARLSAFAVALATVVEVVMPGATLGGTGIVNPLGIDALAGAVDVMGLALAALVVIPCGLAIASVVVRYRATDLEARQQLKWFGWAGLALFVSIALGLSNVGPMAEGGWLVIVVGIAFLPIAVGIAIFRYRLYEIDRIISRTIAWTIVTVMLVALFAGLVVGLQALLAGVTQGQTLAGAASTLAAFALFQPVRRRIQSAVDRRFDRARYDGERTATAFAERLRDLADLAELETDVARTVGSALRPISMGIWVRERRRERAG